ncbi:mechanosensitive ion channel domain-containing protein [Chlamydiota bacterium]
MISLFSIGKPIVVYTSFLILFGIFRKRLFIQKNAITLHCLLFLFFLNLLIPEFVLLNIVPFWTDLMREYQILLVTRSFLTFFVCLLILKSIDTFVIEKYLHQKKNVQIPVLFKDLIKFTLLVIVVFILLNTKFGVKPTALITTSAVLSAIVGFALQDTLGNIFSGISIHGEKPFSVGDWIEINELEGQVTAINWRATRIKTLDGNNLILPNNTVSRERIINYSTPTKSHAISCLIGFPYSSQPSLLKKSALDVVSNHPLVQKKPFPQLRLKSFDDYAIEYELRFWILDHAQYLNIKDELLSQLWYVLKRNNIEIPFPIRTVYLRNDTIDRKKSKHDQDINTFQLLRNLALFSSLSDNEINELIDNGKRTIYCSNETIIKEGNFGQTFFLIEEGSLTVFVSDKAKQKSVKVQTLTNGDFFGEISLLTGEPIQATIKTDQDVLLFEIDKAAFSNIIMKNPEAIKQLTQVLTERQLMNQTVMSSKKEEFIEKKRIEIREGLLNKIKSLFNIKKL